LKKGAKPESDLGDAAMNDQKIRTNTEKLVSTSSITANQRLSVR
jgi:hypothetical protein